MRTKVVRHTLRGAGLVCAAALALTACSSNSSSDSGSDGGAVSASALDAALNKGGTITVWAWEPTLKKVVTDFEAKYPKVHVNLVNAGTGDKQYTALQNAVQAGRGAPDVAQIEYYALGQFALGKSLQDLSKYGASSLSKQYSPGPWNSVSLNGGVYALPMDSGPMALFYNKKVFDKYKLKVPTTWDEYVSDAQKLHAANPKAYITNDAGDAGFTTSMIWQAGGHPYTVNGTKVSVDFGDAGSKKFAGTWQKLLSDKLVAPITSWSDQWYKGLGDGTIATLAIGAWMPANLSSGVPSASGDWRVAPLPQWQKGQTASSENGGSSLAVMKSSTKQDLAYGFLKFANAGAGVQDRIKGGAFPATVADLNSPTFLNTPFPYFGGQKANQVFSASAKNAVTGWQYLPFQVYANSIFNDTVGKAYVSKTTLSSGLKSWQDASVKYGSEQGFTTGK
ncbi:ABC transporter substrate-binding protein [Streptomyces diastatochromogenes]|uniref:Sugar ABC transporter substrate-binding protein n=1 Tax=Streptomyces diastatochromogenes TaxID=42236 RepID=A0A233S7H4_STRDA|nr:sugar ABC transporter substrate-binding protein [Streptomyces diastatochromogenes]MCZ0990628.1 sugar ABC transporter substrate-binding protein [Streptomyces diastatochromogenes]OXY91610.1 sugar ABC transporter substrate-binding protein [Streptomyces diastatochromogenes]